MESSTEKVTELGIKLTVSLVHGYFVKQELHEYSVSLAKSKSPLHSGQTNILNMLSFIDDGH